MTMTKKDLIQNYGCVDCDATDEAAAKYKKVDDAFRDALNKRREELGLPPIGDSNPLDFEASF